MENSVLEDTTDVRIPVKAYWTMHVSSPHPFLDRAKISTVSTTRRSEKAPQVRVLGTGAHGDVCLQYKPSRTGEPHPQGLVGLSVIHGWGMLNSIHSGHLNIFTCVFSDPCTLYSDLLHPVFPPEMLVLKFVAWWRVHHCPTHLYYKSLVEWPDFQPPHVWSIPCRR